MELKKQKQNKNQETLWLWDG